VNKPAKQLIEQNVALKYIECNSLNDLTKFSFDPGPTDALIFKFEDCQIKMPIPDSVLTSLCKMRRQVIILLELASTTDTLPDCESFLSTQAFLKAFDRVIVQTLEDANEMLAIGAAGNVVFLPDSFDDSRSYEMKRQRIRKLIIGLKHDRQLL
jgi:hypothetical protein